MAAASEAEAETMVVYSIAPASSRIFCDAGDVGELLADGDVDAVERLVVLQLALLGGLVLLGLGNDGVHRDGGLAGGTVTDDELALAAADGIMASMDMMPVCTGTLTDFRLMMPGAIFSIG